MSRSEAHSHIGDIDLHHHHSTMSSFSGLDSVTIVGYFLHLGQLLSTCLPFALVAIEDTLQAGIGNGCFIVWCFCSLHPSLSS